MASSWPQRLFAEVPRRARTLWQKRGAALLRRWPEFFIAFHFAKMAYLFRGVTLTTGLPLMNTDYVLYFTRAIRTSIFMAASNRPWGYDPFEMAGYPSGPVHEVGSMLISMAAWTFKEVLPPALTILAIEIEAFVFAPFLIVLAVLNFGGTRKQAWSAFAMVVTFFGTFEYLSAIVLRHGFFTFIIGSFAAVWLVSHFWRWLHSPRLISWLVLTAGAALFPQLHPALLLALVPMPLMYARKFRQLKPETHALIASTIATTISANWYWIEPYVMFSDWHVPNHYWTSFSSLWRLYGWFWPWWIRGFSAAASVALVGVAFLGLSRRSSLTPGLRWIIASTIASLAVIVIFGTTIDLLESLQPARFVFPLFVYLCLASAFGVERWMSLGPGCRRAGTMAAIAAVALSSYVWVSADAGSDRKLTTALPRQQKGLVGLVRTRGPFAGRLLIESFDSALPHISELLPILSRQHVLGGPDPAMFLKARFTLFSGNYLREGRFTDQPIGFGKQIKEITAERFRGYLDLYNVNLVAVRSPSMQEALLNHSDLFQYLGHLDGYNLLKVKGPSKNWFYRGSGTLAADYDRFTITGPSRGILVLKFHWIHTLQANVPVRPVYLMDDPVPFILLDNRRGENYISVWNGSF